MEGVIGFLYNWQQLVGALFGALIAVAGSVWVNNHLSKKAERKKQYSNLIAVLYDIAQFISKCENYLNSKNKGMVSFDIITENKIDYISSAQVFDLDPDIYRSIRRIYGIINMLRYNFENSEAITTIVKKDKIQEIHTQENVLSGRYNRTLILMRYYLKSVYKEFNNIYGEIINVSKKYGYLFPETIKPYKKDYVEQKIKNYGLDKVK